MAQRRVSEFSLNYDSLTDLITNLAGGLIMLVLLLFGLTKGTSEEARARDTQQRTPTAKNDEDATRKAAKLKAEVRVLEEQGTETDEQLARLQEEVEEIKRLADAKQPADHKDPAGERGQPATVEFRPPLMQASNKTQGAQYILTNRRLYILNWDDLVQSFNEFDAEFRTALQRRLATTNFESGREVELSGGDFNVQFRIENLQETAEGWSWRSPAELTRKQGATGEDSSQLLDRDSRFIESLSRLNPDNSFVHFSVLPDSFDLYRTARDASVELGFNTKWEPQKAGGKLVISLGRGGAIVD